MVGTSTPERLRVVAIVSRELAPLMKVLAIADVYGIDEAQELARLIGDLSRRSDVGVILVQRSLMERLKLPEELKEALWPIVVELPDRPADLKLSPEFFYKELVRKFIGYEIHVGVGG